MARLAVRLGLATGLILSAATGRAEQMQRFGDWEVHYVVVDSEFIKPDIASRYGIVRGRDRALVNVSVLGGSGKAAVVQISGSVTNLLGQRQNLTFREVREAEAVYYLAGVKHADEEVLRFDIRVTPPGEPEKRLRFQQKLYWSRR